MNSSLVRRIGASLMSIVLVSVVIFLLIHLIPGDPAEEIAGEQATPERVEQIRSQLGLNDPLPMQYLSWAGGVLRGDLGDSLYSGRNVVDSILEAAGPTLSVTALALLMSAVLGTIAGAVAGVYRGRATDRVVSLAATIGVAMPSYWVGLLLIGFFALDRQMFPATGYASLDEGVGAWLRHVTLPALALGSATIAEVARQTRGGVVDVLDRTYIRAAYARGNSRGRVVRKHVLRNAAIPVVTVFGMQAGRLLGGIVVVEAVFAIPGLGSMAVNAVLRRDFPVIQGYVLFIAVLVVTINFLVDSSYAKINPKVAMQ